MESEKQRLRAFKSSQVEQRLCLVELGPLEAGAVIESKLIGQAGRAAALLENGD